MLMRKNTARVGAVAVCLQKGRVDVVRITREEGAQPVLEICESEPIEGSEADTLGRLRRKFGLKGANCVTLIAESDYQLQVLDAPEVPEEELRDAVRWRLKDVLDFPAEAATVDVFAVPGDPNAPTRARSVYAVAARNELIAERMSAFYEAKLLLDVIDIPEMAQRNVAALYETPGRALALLHLSPEKGLLTFTAEGELHLARGIDIGLEQLRIATGDLRQQLLDRLVLEVQRSLDYFDRQFSYLTLSKLMLAPLPEDAELQTYFSENLYVTVEELQLQDALDISGVPELASSAAQADRFMAIGAALRQESGA
jgi:MSHA biogenesis protein MshI